jgi:hypothetical protein
LVTVIIWGRDTNENLAIDRDLSRLSVFSTRLAASRSTAILPGPEAEQKFFTRIREQCMDFTDLKKWTVRKTTAGKNATFLVPLPIVSKLLVNVEIEAAAATTRRQFPCPVKCRYKYLDIRHRSGSIQTKPYGRRDRMSGQVLEAVERNQRKNGKETAGYGLM